MKTISMFNETLLIFLCRTRVTQCSSDVIITSILSGLLIDMQYLIVFIGAGIGGILRFVMSPLVQRASNGWSFPIGTFSVNMLGCLTIGLLAQLAETKGMFQGDLRLFLFVGVLGGFTTFSSFGFETFQLIRDGQILYAILNAVLQVLLGLLCVWAGWVIGRLI